MTRQACLACLALACVFVPAAFASDVQKLDVAVTDVSIRELEDSQLLVLEIDVLNGGDDEMIFGSPDFELLDRDLRKYGATSGYELRENGESVPRGLCDLLFGDSVNPGLRIDLELCFEMPKGAVPDSLLIHDNFFIQDVDAAKIVPLADDSIGYGALVEKNKPQDQAAADRVREIEDGGGCLIATAARGTELDPQVQNLREIRNKLYGTGAGDLARSFNGFYYSFSPAVADWQRESPAFREAVKLLITPAVASFAISDHEHMDPDGSLAWYVAGVALLNLGMYAGTPALFAVGLARMSKRSGDNGARSARKPVGRA